MATVLLVHGIPGSAANWRRVAALLGDEHRVLAPDLLGFGAEPTPAGADGLLAPSQARHLLAILDDAGVDDAMVVGHDFGGPVAAHLAALAPERVRALALFATNAFPDTPIPFPLSTLNLPLVGSVAERLLFSRPSLAMMVRQGLGHPRPAVDMADYVGDGRQQAAIRTIFASSLRRLRDLYTPVQAALAAVEVPTLVGWGDRDPFFQVALGERTAALVPGARFRVYEGAGHFLPEERPAELADDLRDLVARAAEEGSGGFEAGGAGAGEEAATDALAQGEPA